MDWIKRNLFFVIGGVVAIGLLGGAGYYSFNRYQGYNAAKEKLNSSYEELKRLHGLNPSPGNDKVDNTKLAREQESEAKAMLTKLGRFFQPIPPVVPMVTNAAGQAVVNGEDYAAALRQVIDQLQKEAASGSVLLPPKFGFSFEAQRSLIKFAGSLEPLAIQLAEVRVLAGILNKSKVNSIESIRRERASPDDATGPVTDYLDRVSVTNELAIQTPYELTFRCFSTELGAVLSALAASPYGLVVKGLNIEPAGATGAIDPATGMAINNEAAFTPAPVLTQPTYVPQPAPARRGEEDAQAFARRYGAGGKGLPPPPPSPVPQPMPTVAAPAQPKIQTVLDERQLRVTMLVYVTKLLPPKN